MEKEKLLKAWNDKFNEILGIEYSNPDYFKVHHLLVLTFMIQTDAYSEEYLPNARELLKRFNTGESPAVFQSEVKYSKYFNLKDKNKKIRKDEAGRRIDKYKWNKTIMNVRIDSATNYCSDVTLWAKDVEAIIENKKDIHT